MSGFKGVLSAVILLAGLWWILTDGSPTSWVIGLPALAAALWVSRRMRRGSPERVSTRGLVLFVPFFLWQSLRGGVDVALRTLAPHMRIQPHFYNYRTSLVTPAARTFFVNCVSLLPGTLAADMHGQWVDVHALTTDSDADSELARLENAVARLFSDDGVQP